MSLAKDSWMFGQPRFIDDGEDALYIEFPDRTVKYVPERTCKRITHGLERNREIATVSWTCSKCGRHMGRDDSFCPNCGARVKEEA